MARRTVIGILGGGDRARPEDLVHAESLGELVARRGWIVLTGGRDAGVMRAATDGAKKVAGSLTVGILPCRDAPVAPGIDVVIVTDLGSGRNNVNVLSSRAVVACGTGGPGTVSEVALALRNGTPVVLLDAPPETVAFWSRLGVGEIRTAATPDDAIDRLEELIAGPG